jgi:hypothetical protein
MLQPNAVDGIATGDESNWTGLNNQPLELKMLREREMKVMTFPPHTTQVFHALDLSLPGGRLFFGENLFCSTGALEIDDEINLTASIVVVDLAQVTQMVNLKPIVLEVDETEVGYLCIRIGEFS